MIRLNNILNTKTYVTETYKSTIYKDLNILFRLPEGWQESDKNSAVIFIHGGGWSGGSPFDYIPHINFFAENGFAAFSVEYRLVPTETDFESCISDCEDAISYIRKNAERFGIDSEKIIAIGDSAGGYLAACMGTPSMLSNPKMKANFVVNCCSVLDMTGKWRKKVRAPSNFMGNISSEDDWKQRYEQLRKLSPLYMADSNNSPTVIINGINDTVTEPEIAMAYYTQLKNLGVKVEIKLFDDMDHAFLLFNYIHSNEKVLEIVGLISEYLKSHNF